jgi:hypothetical protein
MIDPEELRLKALREALRAIGVEPDDVIVEDFLGALEERGYTVGQEINSNE